MDCENCSTDQQNDDEEEEKMALYKQLVMWGNQERKLSIQHKKLILLSLIGPVLIEVFFPYCIALMMISQLYQRNMFKCWEIQLAVQNQTSQSAKSSKFNICLPLISFKTIQSSCRGDYVLYLLEFNLLKSKQVHDWHIKKTDLSPTRYMKEIRQFKVHTHSNRNSCRGDYAGHTFCTFISFYLKSK